MSDRKTSKPSSIPTGITLNGGTTTANSGLSHSIQTLVGAHAVQYCADGACFDTVSNVFVLPENTTLTRQ